MTQIAWKRPKSYGKGFGSRRLRIKPRKPSKDIAQYIWVAVITTALALGSLQMSYLTFSHLSQSKSNQYIQEYVNESSQHPSSSR
jgi:hypothetical protein